MSYQEKIDAAIAILVSHNEVIKEGNPGFVNTSLFTDLLKSYGAIAEDDLKKLSWENILDILTPAFVKPPIVSPRLLAEKMANIFRNKDVEQKSRPISTLRADRMTLKQLVECFDPEEIDNPVSVRLKSLSRNEPFIVFSTGRTVDVDNTLKILLEVKQGYEGPKTVVVDGKVKSVHKIGDIPDNYADENPIYCGRPLRPNGDCDQTGRSWEGVNLQVRQFVRLLIEMDMVKPNIDASHHVIDMALLPHAFDVLRKRYQQTAIKFDELEKLGKLPRLQIPLQAKKEAFGNAKQINWNRR